MADATFEKVLFKDDYTSANEVLLDPRNPNVLYATLWSQQQSFIEGQGFGNAGLGIFKSTDGGTTWAQLGDGLPAVLQANIAIAPSDPNILYAAVCARHKVRSASTSPPTAAHIGPRRFAPRARLPEWRRT